MTCYALIAEQMQPYARCTAGEEGRRKIEDYYEIIYYTQLNVDPYPIVIVKSLPWKSPPTPQAHYSLETLD